MIEFQYWGLNLFLWLREGECPSPIDLARHILPRQSHFTVGGLAPIHLLAPSSTSCRVGVTQILPYSKKAQDHYRSSQAAAWNQEEKTMLSSPIQAVFLWIPQAISWWRSQKSKQNWLWELVYVWTKSLHFGGMHSRINMQQVFQFEDSQQDGLSKKSFFLPPTKGSVLPKKPFLQCKEPLHRKPLKKTQTRRTQHP